MFCNIWQLKACHIWNGYWEIKTTKLEAIKDHRDENEIARKIFLVYLFITSSKHIWFINAFQICVYLSHNHSIKTLNYTLLTVYLRLNW